MSHGDDPNIGRLVAGRYRLDAVLGRGGFGSVYRAWDTQIGRDVAVKLLDVLRDARGEERRSQLAERVRREAMAAGRIHHPCIVTIHDYGISDADGLTYLVMELLRGHDLAQELHMRGPMLPERALRLFIPLLEALGQGHELGIIHKDIKPQNIFLREPGTTTEALCLVDFGVARVVHEDKLTLTGLIVGTPQYMAPEYITDTLVTPALDVYQMGLILAEIITGVPAVPHGESFVKSCNRHFTGDLQIPDDLYLGRFGEVLKCALAPSPAKRYPDAATFASELTDVDPKTVTIDSHDTAVFVRPHEPVPTLDEPPMFPPMQPDEVSAQLAREEQGGLDVATTDVTRPPAEFGAPSGSSDAHPNPLRRLPGSRSVIEPEPTPRPPVRPLSPPPAAPGQEALRHQRYVILALAMFGLVAMVGAAALAVLVSSEDESEGAAAVDVATALDPPPPAAPIEILVEPIETSRDAGMAITIRLETRPSGATVRHRDDVVGTTPLALDAALVGEPIVIEREGFLASEVVVEPGMAQVTLRREKPPQRASDTQRKPSTAPMRQDTLQKLTTTIDEGVREPTVPAEQPETPEPPPEPKRWERKPVPTVMP